MFRLISSLLYKNQINQTVTITRVFSRMAAASGRGQQVRCQYHPDAHLAEDYRAGDMICTECGLVVGDRVIDVGRSARIVDAQ